MRKTILVTGASGFLGRELVKQLLQEEEHSVIAVTSQCDLLPHLLGHRPNFRLVHTLDLINRKVSLSEGLDVVVNCAFPRTSEPHDLASGVCLTENLIGAILDIGVGKLINISSQSVYSQKAKDPTDESARPCPESLYGMAKFACERIVATMCRGTDVEYSNVRMASLFGVEFHARLINRFVKSVLMDRPIVVVGGEQDVSYLAVEDAAAGIAAMIRHRRRWAPVYNLGNSDFISVLGLAELVRGVAKEYTSKEAMIEVKNGNSDFSNLIDSRRFREEFDWTPKCTIARMVRDAFRFYSRSTNLA